MALASLILKSLVSDYLSKTGSDVPAVSGSKLIRRMFLSRLLDAGVGWRQYTDDASSSTQVEACCV